MTTPRTAATSGAMSHDPHCCHNDSCSHHDHDEEEFTDDDFPEPTAEELFGPSPPAPPVPLRAGPVECWFDPEWGFLRRITVGGVEAVRAIYPAVRNAEWKTVRPAIENLRVEAAEDHFRIAFDAVHEDAGLGVDFRWTGTITGQPDGTLTYEFDGAARTAMKTNRTGLCVLHPIPACAGRPVRVGHVDGSSVETVFPELISPHQPIFNVRSLTHSVTGAVQATVTMEGDSFETEDQRNWTDASFKTYGGALAKGLPLDFPAGHRVRQTVRVEWSGPWPAPMETAAEPVIVTLPEHGTMELPSLGTRWAPEVGLSDDTARDRLRALGFGHYLLDTDVTDAGWPDPLRRGLEEAAALGLRVILRLIFTPNHQPAVRELASLFAGAADRLLAVLVLNKGEPTAGSVTLDLVRRAFAGVAPEVILAAAPADNFADLNRFRPPAEAWCAPPVSPQVHAFDIESILENAQAQPAMLATIRSFNPHPILLGPVALTRRRLVDPRHGSLFTAAWTAASLAAVLPTGELRAATYHEHAGPMGVLDTPTEEVFAGLAGATRTAPTSVSAPARVAALTVFTDEGERRVLLANLTREPVEIALDGDEDDVMEFGPFAVAWLEA